MKLNNPLHIPKPMLFIIGINYLLWSLLLGIVSIQSGGTLYTLLALVSFLPLIIMGMLFARLILYFYYAFFWYVNGCLSSIGIALAGVYSFGIFSGKIPNIPALDMSVIPENTLLYLGSVGMVFVGIWMVSRRFTKKAATT